MHVVGGDPALGVHLRAWCRTRGHEFAEHPDGGWSVVRGRAELQRWAGADGAPRVLADLVQYLSFVPAIPEAFG